MFVNSQSVARPSSTPISKNLKRGLPATWFKILCHSGMFSLNQSFTLVDVSCHCFSPCCFGSWETAKEPLGTITVFLSLALESARDSITVDSAKSEARTVILHII